MVIAIRHRSQDKKSKLSTDNKFIQTQMIRTKKKSVRLFFGLVLLSILYFTISYFINLRTSINLLQNVLYTKKLEDIKYVVVIDAGSTGSRAMVFSFSTKAFSNEIELINEHLVSTKPGISAYAENPENAFDSISYLLNKIINDIPKSQWPHTPLLFRATAGLRLLSNDVANKLLNVIRQGLKMYQFLLNEKSVEIMDGNDEGLCSWITVNYLLGTLNNDAKKTMAALDLGGGSTQVTLAITQSEKVSDLAYVHDIVQFDKSSIYTKSYLGLGLKAARYEILIQRSENLSVLSHCLNEKFKNISWTYSNYQHYINGILKDNHDLIQCSNYVRKFVMDNVDEIQELSMRKIVAFSYYFDKAVQNTTSGRIVSIKEYKDTATKVCLNPLNENAFECVDLVFISNLLEFGFKLNEDTKIKVLKKIDGHEISWALGLAIQTIQNYSRKNFV